MRAVELLAPVGKFENALAAIENGADAIFVGGKAFNARYFADNFEDDELEKIIKYCKLRGVETHVTVNILVKNQEIEELLQYLSYLASLKVDAVIIQDLGVARIVREYFPELTMHASTQMSAHSLEDVLFLKSCGFKRVVLARELTLEEIKFIKKESGIEIETFIHGALCYAYSGQCLLSSQIGGRSGNRGRCAQPCRMTYSLLEKGNPIAKDLHLLSPKDLCTLSFLPQLIDAGIDSFKMEGRMKSPEYVASVTSIYNKYIELALKHPTHYQVEPEDMATLQSIFNRGGFTDGYYFKKTGKEMMTHKTPKNIGLHIGKIMKYDRKTKLATIFTEKELHPGDGLEIWNKKKHAGVGISKQYEAGKSFTVRIEDWVDEQSPVYLSKNNELLKVLKRTYVKPKRKLKVQAVVEGRIGQPVRFTLNYKEYEVTAVTDSLEKAQNAPLTREVAFEKLSKMGATPFELESLEGHWDESAYMNISKLNEVRREAAEKLEQLLYQKECLMPVNYLPQYVQRKRETPIFIAHIENKEQLKVCLEEDKIAAIYWEWSYNNQQAKEALKWTCEAKKDFYLVLPPIIKDKVWKKIKSLLNSWEETDCKGYVVRNLGSFAFIKGTSKEKVLDYTFNIMNNECVVEWTEKGATSVTLSPELSKDEIKEMKGPLEYIAYGRLPVMTTEQCLLGHYQKCRGKDERKGSYSLQDRKNVEWPIVTDCMACNMQILMDEPFLTDVNKHLKQTDISRYRLRFTFEEEDATRKVLAHYISEVRLEGVKGKCSKAID